jgi:hypothetical protein
VVEPDPRDIFIGGILRCFKAGFEPYLQGCCANFVNTYICSENISHLALPENSERFLHFLQSLLPVHSD